MSNIGKTSANIKKKLTFGDYRKPAKQQGGKKAKQSTSKQANKSTAKPVHKSVSKQVVQPAVRTVPQHDVVPVTQQVVIPVVQQVSKPVKRSTDVPVTQQDVVAAKTKATFYLGEQENAMLMKLFVNSLLRNDKVDKSALVCEAIRLLYKQDK